MTTEKQSLEPYLDAFREELRKLGALELNKIAVASVPRLPREARELELHQAALVVNLEASVLARLVHVRRVSEGRRMVRVDDLKALVANPPPEVASAIRAGAEFNAALDAVLPADGPKMSAIPNLFRLGEALRARLPVWPEPHERRACALLCLAGFYLVIAGFDVSLEMISRRRALRRLRDLLAITATATGPCSPPLPSAATNPGPSRSKACRRLQALSGRNAVAMRGPRTVAPRSRRRRCSATMAGGGQCCHARAVGGGVGPPARIFSVRGAVVTEGPRHEPTADRV